MPAGKARLVFERDSSSEVAAGSTIVVSGAGGSTEIGTLDGYHASDFLSPRYLTLQADSNLTQERVFTPGYGLEGTDGGAGGTYGLSLHLRSPSGLIADASGLAVADTLAGSGLSMTDKVMAIKLQSPSGLSIDANGLAIDDNVAGNGLTIASKVMAVGTPSAVSSTSTNTTTADSHTHAATAYDDSSTYPGHLLKSDASGYLKLVRLTATDRLRTSLVDSETGTNLKLAPAQDLDLQPGGTARVRTLSGVRLQSDNFASQTTGWAVAYSGAADFRYIYTDELHAKAFVADLEQALAGGQIISKSVAPLSRDFTAPAAGADAYLWVECFQGFPAAEVFAANDYVMVRTFDRSGGGLSITNCFGTVSAPFFPDPQSEPPEQRWTFTRLSGTVNGQPAAGYMEEDTLVKRGALALDFGVSGNGYHEVNAIDGLMAENSPYNQTVKWATHPWYDRTVTTRTGNLKGIFNVAGEYGLYAGTGVTDADQFVRISNQAVEAHNLPIKLYDSSNVAIMLQPAASPYMAMGVPIPTGWLTQSGWWAGKDSGVYKQYLGTVSGGDVTAGLKWDGTTLTVKGQLYVTGGDAAKTDLSNVLADTVVGKVNAGATLIQPGRVLISGATTLDSWRYGNTTYIDGGDIYTGTVTADKILAHGMNLLDDWSFERGGAGWVIISGGLASDYPHSGTYAICVTATGSVVFAAYITVPVIAGRNYCMSLWLLHLGGTTGLAGAEIEWLDKAGSHTGDWWYVWKTPSATWSMQSNVACAPSTAAYAKIWLYNVTAQSGTVFFDDCEFYCADGNVLVGTPNSARVEINTTGLTGYSDATTKQFYLRTSDGRAMFGGGKNTMDASGFILSGNETSFQTYNSVRWLTSVDPPGGNEVARVEAGRLQGTMPQIRMIANPQAAYNEGYAIVQAESPGMPYTWLQLYSGLNGSSGYLEANGPNNTRAFVYSIASNTTEAVHLSPRCTIYQGTADDAILTLDSSDVSHPFTSLTSAAAYGTFAKYHGGSGGLCIRGFKSSASDAGYATVIDGYLGEAADTSKSSSAYGIIALRTYVTDGSNFVKAPASGANIITIHSAWNTRAIFDADGNLWLGGHLNLGGYNDRYLYVGGTPAVDLYWHSTKLNRAPGQAGDTGGITVVTGVTVDGTGHVTGVTTRGLTFVDGIVTAVT